MGAPRVVYEIEPTGRYSIGLHIDPARLDVVLLDLAGDIAHSLTVPTPDAQGPSGIFDLIEALPDPRSTCPCRTMPAETPELRRPQGPHRVRSTNPRVRPLPVETPGVIGTLARTDR